MKDEAHYRTRELVCIVIFVLFGIFWAYVFVATHVRLTDTSGTLQWHREATESYMNIFGYIVDIVVIMSQVAAAGTLLSLLLVIYFGLRRHEARRAHLPIA